MAIIHYLSSGICASGRSRRVFKYIRKSWQPRENVHIDILGRVRKLFRKSLVTDPKASVLNAFRVTKGPWARCLSVSVTVIRNVNKQHCGARSRRSRDERMVVARLWHRHIASSRQVGLWNHSVPSYPNTGCNGRSVTVEWRFCISEFGHRYSRGQFVSSFWEQQKSNKMCEILAWWHPSWIYGVEWCQSIS